VFDCSCGFTSKCGNLVSTLMSFATCVCETPQTPIDFPPKNAHVKPKRLSRGPVPTTPILLDRLFFLNIFHEFQMTRDGASRDGASTLTLLPFRPDFFVWNDITDRAGSRLLQLAASSGHFFRSPRHASGRGIESEGIEGPRFPWPFFSHVPRPAAFFKIRILQLRERRSPRSDVRSAPAPLSRHVLLLLRPQAMAERV